jgi:predicted metal-binding membrane protein
VNEVARNAAWPWAVVMSLCGASWIYVVYLAYGMEHMDIGADMLLMPAMMEWGMKDLLLVLVMWTLMMMAMMLPSAVSMLHTFVDVGRKMEPSRAPVDTLGFAGGYIIAWAGYGVLATLLQWGLLEARLVSPMMESSSTWLGGTLLLVAGAYQFTAWKESCLTGCRSPVSFIAQEWRPRFQGAMRMGWRHGLDCIGCCWVLMLLLFVLGVMNLAWNVALAILVLLEKHMPQERWFLRATGTAFIAWGVILLATGAAGTFTGAKAEVVPDFCTTKVETLGSEAMPRVRREAASESEEVSTMHPRH